MLENCETIAEEFSSALRIKPRTIELGSVIVVVAGVISVLRCVVPAKSAADLLRSQKAPVRIEAPKVYTGGLASPIRYSAQQVLDVWLPDQGSNLGPAD